MAYDSYYIESLFANFGSTELFVEWCKKQKIPPSNMLDVIKIIPPSENIFSSHNHTITAIITAYEFFLATRFAKLLDNYDAMDCWGFYAANRISYLGRQDYRFGCYLIEKYGHGKCLKLVEIFKEHRFNLVYDWGRMFHCANEQLKYVQNCYRYGYRCKGDPNKYNYDFMTINNAHGNGHFGYDWERILATQCNQIKDTERNRKIFAQQLKIMFKTQAITMILDTNNDMPNPPNVGVEVFCDDYVVFRIAYYL